MMIALIMAGGAGTRFWPESRRSLPKQFLKIATDRSMLQLTVERLLSKMPIGDIYIVTAASQVKLVLEHLPSLPVENIIIEPFGMNTAPCIALSIAYLKKRYDGNINLLVLPADHVIKKTHAFLSAIELAELPAQAGKLVTFGIIPDYPATGYGYIESGEELYSGVHSVQRFKEKPDLKTAESFLAQGNFFWNSGMFYWTLDTIWEALTLHQPVMIEVLGKIVSKWHQQGWTADIDEEYRLMPRLPIDIAIMEPAANRVVIPVDIGWSDVGSWKALADISATDEEGNTFLGPAFSIDSGSNYIRTGKFTALIGVQNLCVIETANSILITTKDRAEDVKKVVDYLAANQKDELL